MGSDCNVPVAMASIAVSRHDVPTIRVLLPHLPSWPQDPIRLRNDLTGGVRRKLMDDERERCHVRTARSQPCSGNVCQLDGHALVWSHVIHPSRSADLAAACRRRAARHDFRRCELKEPLALRGRWSGRQSARLLSCPERQMVREAISSATLLP